VLLAAFGAAAQPAQPVPYSPLQWELRNGEHPKMGPIEVAVPSTSMATPVGKENILSLVFFSCEKSRGKVAIELANAPESDAKKGLRPQQMPRLFCNPRSTAPRAEIAASWVVNELGDALARGLAPSDLRRCASIDVVQEVALPRGWASKVQHIEMELIPYKKELEAVLATCSEGPSVQLAEAPKAAPVETPKGTPATIRSPPTPQPAPAKAPVPADGEWKTARTIASGRTNVRAAPNIDSPIVMQLDAGVLILVQATPNEWWKARARRGSAGPIGYVRHDRLIFP
jgi:hypothetical protein